MSKELSALITAASENDVSSAQYLMSKKGSKKPSALGRINISSASAVDTAVTNGSLAVLKLLLKSLSVDEVYQKGPRGFNLFLLAVKSGQMKIAEYLIGNWKEFSVNDTCMRGNSGLHYATENGDLELMRWLLSKGADVSVINSKGQTALHTAAFKGSIRPVNLLLSEAKGLDLHVRDFDTRTAVDVAKPAVKPLLREAMETVRSEKEKKEKKKKNLMISNRMKKVLGQVKNKNKNKNKKDSVATTTTTTTTTATAITGSGGKKSKNAVVGQTMIRKTVDKELRKGRKVQKAKAALVELGVFGDDGPVSEKPFVPFGPLFQSMDDVLGFAMNVNDNDGEGDVEIGEGDEGEGEIAGLSGDDLMEAKSLTMRALEWTIGVGRGESEAIKATFETLGRIQRVLRCQVATRDAALAFYSDEGERRRRQERGSL